MEKTKRKSGVLLHPTSFPGKFGIGDFNIHAYRFIDYLKEANQRIWQILPLNPTGYDGSPYNSNSAFAGNPILIDLHELKDLGFLTDELDNVGEWSYDLVDYNKVMSFKHKILHKAYKAFLEHIDDYPDFETFSCEEAYWLKDYAIYMALRKYLKKDTWYDWPEEYKDPESYTVKQFAKEHEQSINEIKFIQWIFFKQWRRLKAYANDRGIQIFGDMPIFVSYDSADVWGNQEQFRLKKNGERSVVAGVPPDYFAEDGQLWGNPLYDWKHMEADSFDWWKRRIHCALQLYDLIRLDHFRGFAACWAVPSSEKTARNGKWEQTPGRKLFDELFKEFGTLPVVAEDLGEITQDVTDLRDHYKFDGMKILQFAFTDRVDNYFLPHNYINARSVVYTGTHDNDTTVGWYKSLDERQRSFVSYYLDHYTEENINWKMIRLAFSSIAEIAIIPLQDILGLDTECRLNMPGKSGGTNWGWRYRDDAITPQIIERLAGVTQVFNRA